MSKTHWNYRVVAMPYMNQNKDGSIKEVIIFHILEVYYKDEKPTSYAEGNNLSAETLADLQWGLNMMKQALDKPTLWGGDKFPQEYQ